MVVGRRASVAPEGAGEQRPASADQIETANSALRPSNVRRDSWSEDHAGQPITKEELETRLRAASGPLDGRDPASSPRDGDPHTAWGTPTSCSPNSGTPNSGISPQQMRSPITKHAGSSIFSSPGFGLMAKSGRHSKRDSDSNNSDRPSSSGVVAAGDGEAAASPQPVCVLAFSTVGQ